MGPGGRAARTVTLAGGLLAVAGGLGLRRSRRAAAAEREHARLTPCALLPDGNRAAGRPNHASQAVWQVQGTRTPAAG